MKIKSNYKTARKSIIEEFLSHISDRSGWTQKINNEESVLLSNAIRDKFSHDISGEMKWPVCKVSTPDNFFTFYVVFSEAAPYMCYIVDGDVRSAVVFSPADEGIDYYITAGAQYEKLFGSEKWECVPPQQLTEPKTDSDSSSTSQDSKPDSSQSPEPKTKP